MDIFDAIDLSRNTYQDDSLLLAPALCFWSSHSNIFFFRLGPFTPTLMDMTAITGLRPYSVTLSPAFSAESIDAFFPILDSKKILSYEGFAQIFVGHGTELVSKTEHVAFLWYWLCYSIFCTRSQDMDRNFLPIALALASGQKLALGPYFLDFLYWEMLEAIKPTPYNESHLVIDSGCGVLWFLQLCLQFYFPSLLRRAGPLPVASRLSIYFG